MTLTLELMPETQQALLEEARRQGKTPELLAAEELHARFVSVPAAAEDPLRCALARLLDEAQTLEPLPSPSAAGRDTGFDEGLHDKYRKQGLDL